MACILVAGYEELRTSYKNCLQLGTAETGDILSRDAPPRSLRLLPSLLASTEYEARTPMRAQSTQRSSVLSVVLCVFGALLGISAVILSIFAAVQVAIVAGAWSIVAFAAAGARWAWLADKAAIRRARQLVENGDGGCANS